ncbi:MAG TPA: hypothetical protein VN645_12570 [Steroidobacteraceae bacterium]|nr:hypothetical protein [Steroidobacteraceae bacterium]
MNRLKQLPRLGLAATALLLLQMQDAAFASVDPRPAYEMEEVQVLGARVKLKELRAEIVRTEDQFYTELNKLLDDPEMHVNCEVGPPLGTHLSKRVCRPQFVATANAAYAREMIQELTARSLATTGGSFVEPVSPGIAVGSSEIVFRSKVIGLLKGSPTLRELAQRRAKLEVLLKAAQKAHFRGSKPASDG